MFERPDQIDNKLYVLTTVFNPMRYRTRWKLYEDFADHVAQSGAVLFTAEVAFGKRDFAVTHPDNPYHLQLVTNGELWLKENALDLLIQRLPLDWKYVAWVDADIHFVRSDWANETIHQLQHYDVLQMWSEAQDLNANYESIVHHESFLKSWYKYGQTFPEKCTPYYYYGGGAHGRFEFHPGFAWATKKHVFNSLGGLIDFGILGSADMHMATALIGMVDRSLHPGLHENYRMLCKQWEERALRYVNLNIGFMPGKIPHYWHGPKAARRYKDRWKILTENHFDPLSDIKRDWQGLWQLTDDKPKLRADLRQYFAGRNEDQL